MSGVRLFSGVTFNFLAPEIENVSAVFCFETEMRAKACDERARATTMAMVMTHFIISALFVLPAKWFTNC
jgi:hypothetical protein